MEIEITVIICNDSVATVKAYSDQNTSKTWDALPQKEKLKVITAVFLSQCEITYKVIE